MYVDKIEYLNVIKNAQLISCDLLIINENNEVLLGMRNNEPAKNFWFVPGGRVYKNESINESIKRVSINEIGCELNNGKIVGVYNHTYNTNFDNDDYGTVYIVFAHIFKVNKETVNFKNDEQHSNFKWFNLSDINKNKDIHQYVKNYFILEPNNKIY